MRSSRQRRLFWAGLVGSGLVLTLNAVAYRQAARMTRFVPAGERTPSPQQLAGWEKLSVLVQGVTVPRHSDNAPPQGAYRTVRFRARDGVRLEAWDIPAPAARGTVVMFHGYATGKSALRGTAAVLRELGYRCVLVDFRGSGGSEGMRTTLGWEEARDVAAAADWVGEPAILYGQSMGAAAVLRAVATEGVRPAGIILESPYDRLVNTVGHRYEALRLPAWPFAPLLVFWGGWQHGFNAFELNPVDDARAVQCPALVLVGTRDPWVKVAEARAVADAMNGHGELWVLPQAGHRVPFRQAAPTLRERLETWRDKPSES